MSSKVRVLIVDDEAAIRDTLHIHLQAAGYELREATTGAAGIEQTKNFHPHVIILDLGLPDMNGYAVLKELRTWTQIPILVLTVTDAESTKVRLLDAGASDYLCKPFGAPELLARLRVALRTHGMIEATTVFKSGDLEIDLNKKTLFVRAQTVKLTSTEFEVLSRLVRDQGKVVSQALLLKQVWGSTAEDQSHYLRIYIKQLRKKIEVNPSTPVHILTEPGVGYRLV